MNLFDMMEPIAPRAIDFIPKDPPRIRSAGIKRIQKDFETTGLAWFEKDRPVSCGICLPDGSTHFLAWGHTGGGNNISEDGARRWMKDELPGVHIENLNTRFEVHMAREFGVDYEAMGCTVSDVGHYAALLDDHRKRFSLEALVKDMLFDGEEKVKAVNGIELDGRRMHTYHADLVAVRAMADVRQVKKLSDIMMPKLEREDLMEVLALESQVIYPVCEMEKNGAILDHELVAEWRARAKKEFQDIAMLLSKTCGTIIDPTKRSSQIKLFKFLRLPISHTEGGNASFTDEVLKQFDHEEQPVQIRTLIHLLRRAIKLSSLEAKFFSSFTNRLDSKGIFRYALHQLRSERADNWDAGQSGTVTGRFSSTEILDGIGNNIQQIFNPAKQRVSFGYDDDDTSHDDSIFIIRQLFVAGQGKFLSADAEQIEYRLFASYTKSDRLIQAYKENPRVSFHRMMHGILKEKIKGWPYKKQKDLNFAKIYGAGIRKMAWMMGFITKEQYQELIHIQDSSWRDSPLLKSTFEVNEVYNQEIPEVEPLMKKAMKLATTRGYVKSIMGRRSRFINGERAHKALNGVIQPSAADAMKQKLVELHRERKYTDFLLRWTVHDEVDGDAQEEHTAKRVDEVLNHQSFPQLAVPILWKVSVGNNWKEAS